MNVFFAWLLAPGWNRLTVVGGILTLVGVILTPLLIGIPVMGVGFGLFSLGIMASILKRIPGGKRIVTEFEKMFKQMRDFLQELIKG